jgi:hypothetical protein
MRESKSNMWQAATTFRATTDIEEGIEHSDILSQEPRRRVFDSVVRYVLVDTPSTGGERHYDTSKLGNVLAAINAFKVPKFLARSATPR